MKKTNNTLILITGILLFFLSYMFDQQINHFFKSIRLTFLDLIFSLITNFGIVFVVMLIVPIIIVYNRNKKVAYLLLFAFIAAFILAFAMKLVFLRQRPDYIFTYPFTEVISYSFPSMHAMVIFALLPILTAYIPKQKNFWIVFAFLVTLSRVYLGLHYLSDVVFGAFVGYFLGGILHQLYESGRLWKK